MSREMDKETKQKLMFGVLAIGGVLAMIWLNVVQPFFDDKATLEMNFVKLKNEKMRIQSQIRKKHTAEASNKTAQEQLKEQCVYYIPEKNGIFKLRDIIRDLCAQIQISKNEYSVEAANSEKRSFSQRSSARVNLTGGYHVIGRFVEALEKTIPFAKIDGLEIKRDGSSVLGTVSFSLPIMNSQIVKILAEVEKNEN